MDHIEYRKMVIREAERKKLSAYPSQCIRNKIVQLPKWTLPRDPYPIFEVDHKGNRYHISLSHAFNSEVVVWRMKTEVYPWSEKVFAAEIDERVDATAFLEEYFA